jgi:hypothetical protein
VGGRILSPPAAGTSFALTRMAATFVANASRIVECKVLIEFPLPGQTVFVVKGINADSQSHRLSCDRGIESNKWRAPRSAEMQQ